MIMMTAEEYVQEQCAAFYKTCEDMAYKIDWDYGFDCIEKLDKARITLWPGEIPGELINSISIMWAAVFTQILATNYISKWTVDPQSKTPSLIIKCGNKGLQVKSVLIAAQAFNQGRDYVEFWAELKQTLDNAGAEFKK